MNDGDLVADRFEIERVAGRGGMGAVYRARDRTTSQPVAVKVLHSFAESFEARFRREAEVLAQLEHPGIVRYVAHGRVDGGECFLAMEWLEGEDLSTRLRRLPLRVDEALALAARVAEALGAAHALGLVHRDIKPGNVFLPGGAVDRAKLLDFGVVMLRDADEALTGAGDLIGTPGYLSPEQARGERGIDARADVFSLGCVLYRCLVGHTPFEGRDTLSILMKTILESAPRLRASRSDLPVSLDELVARMLAPSRDARPRDGSAVREELAHLDALDGGAPAPSNDAASVLTDSERLVRCIVLVRAAGARDLDATIANGRSLPMSVAIDVAARCGGEIDPLADGSFLVTFATAGAATDQATQAARCALALRAELGDAPIAVVASRSDGSRSSHALGAVLDGAARLVREASGASVRIDEVVAGLLDARFVVDGDDHGLLLRREQPHADATRMLLGRVSPCVGRDREIASLVDLFRECVEDSVARVALVTAPAGVGKSRVRLEAMNAIRERWPDAAVLVARGDPMSAGSPFGMIASAIRRSAGVLDGEPNETRRRKLRARVARHVAKRDLPRVLTFLGELVGVRFADEAVVPLAAARADAGLMGDQMRAAFEDLLAAESSARPVLIVLEDLHWGDLPTMRLVDGALRRLRERSIMVLGLARPEVDDLFPSLWRDVGVQEIRLLELTRKSAAKLARHVLGDAADDATIDHVVERAAGNAFYLEELLRAVAEGGARDDLPETVLAMLQSRIERLEPACRRVLRAASTFGQVFWEDGVRALLGGGANEEVAEWLAVLVKRELVTRRADGRFPEQAEHVFRHALFRDAAYAMLTDHDRTIAHRVAAEWLTAVGETDAVAIAEHLARAGESRRALHWYRRAAEHALEGNDYAATIARAQRGLDAGAEGDARGELFLLQSEAHRWRGEADGTERCGLAALEHLERGSAKWFQAIGETLGGSALLGHVDVIERLVEEAATETPTEATAGAQLVCLSRCIVPLLYGARVAIVDRIGARVIDLAATAQNLEPLAEGWVHRTRAIVAMRADDLGRFADELEHAARAFESAGNVRRACAAWLDLAGDGLLPLGEHARAEALLRRTQQIADGMGMTSFAPYVASALAVALGRSGRLDEAIAAATKAIAGAVDTKNANLEAVSRIRASRIYVARGELARAESEAATALARLPDESPYRLAAIAARVRALTALGRATEAMPLAVDAQATIVQLGKLDEDEADVRLALAEALAAGGSHDESRAAIALATARLHERAARLPSTRRATFEAIPENARTLRGLA